MKLLVLSGGMHPYAESTPVLGDFLRAAEQAAPTDPIIRVEKARIETGSNPPPLPPPLPDALDRALAGLERHTEQVLAAIAARNETQDQVDRAAGLGDRRQAQQTATWRRIYDGFIASSRRQAQEARMTLEEIRRNNPVMGDTDARDYRVSNRNIAFLELITFYLALTRDLLTHTGDAGIEEGWDVDFWGEALGLGPVELARLTEELENFEYQGEKAQVSGHRIEDIAGAEFSAMSRRAGTVRMDTNCFLGSPQAERACRLERDRRYCATVRPLFREWVTKSEGWYTRAARRFDGVAARRLAWGGLQVEDAFVYASTYAREIKFKPDDKTWREQMKKLNDHYLVLVDLVTGFLGKPKGGIRGPFYQIRHKATGYAIDKRNFEAHQNQTGKWIEEVCGPVDRKVIEQLLEEQWKAVQDTLLDRLRQDFDAKWDPTVSCSLSAGKWFQTSIDDTGKISLGGKWKWLQKRFPDGGWTPAEGELARNYKFNFKDGEFVGVSASVEGTAKRGPFTGKGTVTLGTQWNSKTGRWDTRAELASTLGIGYKSKGDYGVACYPGKASVKFDSRAVVTDAMAYLHSLDPN